jgi:hypothetical protein
LAHSFKWKRSKSLELFGEQKRDWENYVRGLKHPRFTLTNEIDKIVWSWDNKLGFVSAKQGYEVQFLEDLEEEQKDLTRDIWNWLIPLRIKLFCWLMIENRILTWENMIKRGFVGPSRCALCRGEEETINHLMINFPFTIEVWNNILKVLKSKKKWEGGHISERFQSWIKQKEKWSNLPYYKCWKIWRQRNLIIFENHPLNVHKVINRVLLDLGEFNKTGIIQAHKVVRSLVIETNLVVGFFDGASQSGGEKCGAGAVLKCLEGDIFSIKMNCGMGTNTRGELLALLSLLIFALHE